MSLKKYYGKKVNIESVSNGSFSGIINDYIYPEDNESGNESIVLDTEDGRAIEFEESDIKNIEVV